MLLDHVPGRDVGQGAPARPRRRRRWRAPMTAHSIQAHAPVQSGVEAGPEGVPGPGGVDHLDAFTAGTSRRLVPGVDPGTLCAPRCSRSPASRYSSSSSGRSFPMYSGRCAARSRCRRSMSVSPRAFRNWLRRPTRGGSPGPGRSDRFLRSVRLASISFEVVIGATGHDVHASASLAPLTLSG